MRGRDGGMKIWDWGVSLALVASTALFWGGKAKPAGECGGGRRAGGGRRGGAETSLG